jgi:hypothetical protein
MNDLELLDRMKERTGTWAELARQLHVTAGVRLDHEAIYKWRKRARIAHSWRPWVLIFARKLELPVSADVTLPRPRRWPAKSRRGKVERAAESVGG